MINVESYIFGVLLGRLQKINSATNMATKYVDVKMKLNSKKKLV